MLLNELDSLLVLVEDDRSHRWQFMSLRCSFSEDNIELRIIIRQKAEARGTTMQSTRMKERRLSSLE